MDFHYSRRDFVDSQSHLNRLLFPIRSRIIGLKKIVPDRSQGEANAVLPDEFQKNKEEFHQFEDRENRKSLSLTKRDVLFSIFPIL